MKKYIIDRFEGSYAICEDETKEISKIPKYKLPLDCKEGDTLIKDVNDMYHISVAETKANEKRIRDKMNRLLEKKGDS